MNVPQRRWLPTGALILVLLAGTLPHVGYLPLWPTSRDSAIWVTQSAPTHPEWARWVFTAKHINRCYRPLAALTYTLDYRLGGFSALPYRLTDLSLHLLCGLLVYLLFRRLAPGLSRWGGVAATAVLLIHPVGQLIVPSLARRSYPLCTALGLAALTLLAPRPGCPTRPVSRAALAALLLTGAVLANELGVTLVFAAGLLLVPGLSGDHGRRRWTIATGAAIGLGVAGAVALRSVAMPGLGGYPERGKAIGATAISVWQTLTAWRAPDGHFAAALMVAGTILAGSFYLWRAWSGRPWSSENGLPALCVGWLIGFTAVTSWVGVWFPREGYVALPPLALLWGSGLAVTMRHLPRRGARSWLALAPQALVAAWLCYASVTAAGANAERLERHRRTEALLRELYEDLASYPRPASVSLVLPRYGWWGSEEDAPDGRQYGRRPHKGYRHPEIWINGILRDRRITVEAKISYMQDPRVDPNPPEMRMAAGSIEFVMPADISYYVPGPEGGGKDADGREFVRLLPPGGDRDQLVYFHDGRTGTLVPFGAASLPPDDDR